jgi:hypothetical protein
MVADVELAFGGSPDVDLSDKRLLMISEAIVSRFPELARYGAFTLNAAVVLACEGRTTSNLDVIELVDILKAMVLLQSAYRSSTSIRVFRAVAVDVAIERWFEGQGDIEQVQSVAEIYHGYSELLSVQQQRIQTIDAALKADTERRKEARDHRYAYVGKALPRAKPSDVRQMTEALSFSSHPSS